MSKSLLQRTKRGALALAVAVTAAFAALEAQAQYAPYGVRSFCTTVEDHGEAILFFMHPTAEYEGVRHVSTERLGNGHKVTYGFLFVSAWTGKSNCSELRFYLTPEGHLDFVSTGERDCIVPPFLAGDVVIKALREIAKDDPDLQNDRELMRILEEGSAKKALVWWLRVLG